MGLLAGYFAFKGDQPRSTGGCSSTTGILGGYTTFSAFSLDTVLLYERGETALAALYVLASVGARRSAACSPAWRWCGTSPDGPLASILHVLRSAEERVSWA